MGEAISLGGRFQAHIDVRMNSESMSQLLIVISQPAGWQSWARLAISISALSSCLPQTISSSAICQCGLTEGFRRRFWQEKHREDYPHLFLIHSHSFGRFIMRYHLLAIQAVGGIKVSSAQNYDQLTAGDVMRLGIIFQFSNTIVLALLIVGARLRVRQKKGVLDRIVYP